MNAYSSLQRAAAETATITGGSHDYIIANAAFMSAWSVYDPIGVLYVYPFLPPFSIIRTRTKLTIFYDERGPQPENFEEDLSVLFQTNLIGQINLFDLILPLFQKATSRKSLRFRRAWQTRIWWLSSNWRVRRRIVLARRRWIWRLQSLCAVF